MGRKAKKKPDQREKGRVGTRWIVATLLTLLSIGGGVAAWQWNRARAAPEPAPRFNLLASTGRVITLDDYLGKQEVVLLFYMAAG